MGEEKWIKETKQKDDDWIVSRVIATIIVYVATAIGIYLWIGGGK